MSKRKGSGNTSDCEIANTYKARRLISYREAERQALEPKGLSDDEEIPNGDAPNGDVLATVEPVNGRSTSSEPSLNGIMNGTATNTERDELEDSLEVDGDDDAMSDGTPALDEDGPNIAAANRRKAMRERAAEREAEEAVKSAKAVRDQADARAKKNESKVLITEKKRLTDELDALKAKLRSLEFDFRSHLFTLRTKPFGYDRFGNKVWWLDGLGSAPLYGDNGKVVLGTARLYLQGVEESDAEYLELRSVSGEDYGPPGSEEVEERRGLEEGEGRLGPGEWAVYETPDQVRLSFLLSSWSLSSSASAACLTFLLKLPLLSRNSGPPPIPFADHLPFRRYVPKRGLKT